MVVHFGPDGSFPGPVGTAEEFVAELRRLRAQSGQPSFRELSRIAEKRLASAPDGDRIEPLPPSTTSEILAGKRLPRLPRLEFVESYVAACVTANQLDERSAEQVVARWRELWRTLAEPAAVLVDTSAPAVPQRRRAVAWPVVLIVFVAGVGLGAAGMRWWSSGRSASAAGYGDECVAADEKPDGQDVFPEPGSRAWWGNNPDIQLVPDERAFEATVRSGTAAPGERIVVKSQLNLVQGRAYAVAFTVTADPAAEIRLRVQDSESPKWVQSYSRDLSASSTACRHIYQFTGAKTSNHSELTFQVGGQPQDFTLKVSDVALVEQSD